MQELHDKFKNQVDFSVVCGVMVTGPHKKPISLMEEYILAGHKDMENLTNVKFGEPYLAMVRQGTELLDSEKPSNAVVAYEKLHPEKIIDFVTDLQNAYFLYGKSLNQDSTYRKLAEKYQVNGDSFLTLMKSDSVQKSTLEEFKKTEEAGISSFPTLLITVQNKTYPLTEGFERYDKLEKKISKLLKENK
jgi:putative protein-disulfide isomerase